MSSWLPCTLACARDACDCGLAGRHSACWQARSPGTVSLLCRHAYAFKSKQRRPNLGLAVGSTRHCTQPTSIRVHGAVAVGSCRGRRHTRSGRAPGAWVLRAVVSRWRGRGLWRRWRPGPAAMATAVGAISRGIWLPHPLTTCREQGEQPWARQVVHGGGAHAG